MEHVCWEALRGFKLQRQWNSSIVSEADCLLNRIVQVLQPTPQERQARTAVICRLQAVLGGMPDFQAARGGRHSDPHGGDCLARVLVFGSFCSSLYHKGSDLDLTITGQWRNRHGQPLHMHCMSPADTAEMLHRIRRALITHQVASADPACPPVVINARVPLVMYKDAVSGVQVDISVCNHGGVFKSRFIRELSQFDARFEALYRLVKLWAELRNLNDPKTGTLNSWSITQMVIFHLQNCTPVILPPLWLLFHNQPSCGMRPLEQQQGGSSRVRQQPANRAGAPYELLETCGLQRQRYQSVYNSSSNSSDSSSSSEGHGLTELLVGFFVRFDEVFVQWLDFERHRSDKMCTWLGRWDAGGCLWRHEYLVAFEDPFDSTDNTARTLGTQLMHGSDRWKISQGQYHKRYQPIWSRNDGGCWRLRDELQSAVDVCSNIRHQQDVEVLLQKLFRASSQEVLQHDFDPIYWLQQQQLQPQQRLHLESLRLQSDSLSDLAQQLQQMTVQQSQHSTRHEPPMVLGHRWNGLTYNRSQQQAHVHRGYGPNRDCSNDTDVRPMGSRAIIEAALSGFLHTTHQPAVQPVAQLCVD